MSNETFTVALHVTFDVETTNEQIDKVVQAVGVLDGVLKVVDHSTLMEL